MFSNPGKRITQSVRITAAFRSTRAFREILKTYLRTRGLHGFNDSLEVKTPFCCIIFATAKHHALLGIRLLQAGTINIKFKCLRHFLISTRYVDKL